MGTVGYQLYNQKMIIRNILRAERLVDVFVRCCSFDKNDNGGPIHDSH